MNATVISHLRFLIGVLLILGGGLWFITGGYQVLGVLWR
jgi:hypothetical protein